MASSSNLEPSSVSMNNTFQTYPSPLASYENVVADKGLFMSTLEKFHSEMGTPFRIPTVKFRKMDLHKLFVEVTTRGGIEQVIRENKWDDVFATFNFSPSSQNPAYSWRMRKHYYSLLHNYEIVYFFKSRGQFPPCMHTQKKEVVIDAVPLQQRPPKQNTEIDALMEESEEQKGYSEKHEDDYSDSKLEQRSLITETTNHIEKAKDLIVAVPVTGVLDGIFESGYFVTVTIGSKKLRGVLYPQTPPPLNTVTQEKVNEDEKAVNKGMEVGEDKGPCSREYGRSQP